MANTRGQEASKIFADGADVGDILELAENPIWSSSDSLPIRRSCGRLASTTMRASLTRYSITSLERPVFFEVIDDDPTR